MDFLFSLQAYSSIQANFNPVDLKDNAYRWQNEQRQFPVPEGQDTNVSPIPAKYNHHIRLHAEFSAYKHRHVAIAHHPILDLPVLHNRIFDMQITDPVFQIFIGFLWCLLVKAVWMVVSHQNAALGEQSFASFPSTLGNFNAPLVSMRTLTSFPSA